MKRRRNAIYTGQSNRVSTGRGDRKGVDAFYKKLNENLLTEDEIEIIPPEQVNPTHDLQDQACIIVDYCIRKILPEVTGLYRWGDEVTPRLRALAPVVDQETAEAARAPIHTAADVAADNAHRVTQGDGYVAGAYTAASSVYYAASAASYAAFCAISAYNAANAASVAYDTASVAKQAAQCLHYALVACIAADHEGAYNRIIALTNEMLESL